MTALLVMPQCNGMSYVYDLDTFLKLLAVYVDETAIFKCPVILATCERQATHMKTDLLKEYTFSTKRPRF